MGIEPAIRLTTTEERFFCPVCSKSFETKISRKRHATYCRRKERSGKPARKKSCFGCVRAKTRCDSVDQRCSECARKGRECSNEQQQMIHLGHSLSKSSLDVTIFEDSNGPLHGPANEIGMFDSYDIVPLNNEAEEFPVENSSHSSSLKLSNGSAYPMLDFLELPADPLSNPFPSISTATNMPLRVSTWSPLHQPTIRLPTIFRPRSSTRSSPLLRNIILSTLKSYTTGLLPRHTLPPFIHRQAFDALDDPGSESANYLPVPLAMCSGIVQMFQAASDRGVNSMKTIWGAIETARNWLEKKSADYDDHLLVAALQALTVYVILRVTHPEGGHVESDIALGRTMMQFAMKTNGFGIKYSPDKPKTLPDWRNWALVDSMRRTLQVLFILSTLVEISTSPHSCSGLWPLGASLPSHRKLWEAESEFDFYQEYFLFLKIVGHQEMPTYHDLYALEYVPETLELERKLLLQKWVEEMEGFGELTQLTMKYAYDGRSAHGLIKES